MNSRSFGSIKHGRKTRYPTILLVPEHDTIKSGSNFSIKTNFILFLGKIYIFFGKKIFFFFNSKKFGQVKKVEAPIAFFFFEREKENKVSPTLLLCPNRFAKRTLFDFQVSKCTFWQFVKFDDALKYAKDLVGLLWSVGRWYIKKLL